MAVQYRTYEECLKAGPSVAAAWLREFGGTRQPKPDPVAVKKRPSWKEANVEVRGKKPAVFRSKLEWDFWLLLDRAFDAHFTAVDYESRKFRVIGKRTYKPDFPTTLIGGEEVMWETKGHLWAKDELRLIAAAERYPAYRWVLVRRLRKPRIWQCQDVTAEGISKAIWCPEWLK